MKKNNVYLFVDGYNIINAWPSLLKLANEVDLDSARERLITIMCEFQKLSGYKVIVVFDAYMIKSGTNTEEQRDNITVIYTKEHESADGYIEKQVNDMKRHDKMIVASNDGMIQRIILSRGGVRISANELWKTYIDFKERLKRIRRRNCKKISKDLVTVDDETFIKLDNLQKELEDEGKN
ncbi:MAG: NYN domain-containing protein [Finegoldia sp.]|nr:NYN domain-containing protein [Finegoldia sp.]